MKIEGLENITVGNLIELSKTLKMSYKEALPLVKDFKEKNNLTDRQALNAVELSKKITGY